MAEALKPCPFCGSTNLSTEDARDFIACRGCGAEGPCLPLGNGSTHSAEAWNRRALSAPAAPEPTDAALIERFAAERVALLAREHCGNRLSLAEARRLDCLTAALSVLAPTVTAAQWAALEAIERATPAAPSVPHPWPLAEWGEEDGAVLWWRFPVDEPPYVGSPLCDDWPGYHTHWTRLAVPAAPQPGAPTPKGAAHG